MTLDRSTYAPRRPIRWAAIAVAHLVFPALLFGGPLRRGTSSFFALGHDALEQSYSWMQVLARALHRGYLPLWDPSTQGGHSFVGEIQTGVFYPVSLLFAYLFGNEQGISMPALEAWVAVHFAIASFGFYWLVREAGGSRVAAFGGALLFAYFGPVAFRAPAQVGIFFGLCWMPYAVAFAWRYLRSERKREAFGCGIVVGLQVVAGHLQPAFHTVLLIASLVLFLRWDAGLRQYVRLPWLRVYAIFALGVGVIALPQLVLAAQYLSDAYRWVSAGDFVGPGERVPFHVFLNNHILTPASLLSIFDPWQFGADDSNCLYVGLPATCLCLWLFSNSMPKPDGISIYHLRKWCLIVAISALVVALGSYGFVAAVMYAIPLITAIRELGRYAILIHFALAIAFAIAIDYAVRSGALARQVATWPRWPLALVAIYVVWLCFYAKSPVIRPVVIQLCLLAAFLTALRMIPRLALPALLLGTVACAWLTREFYLPPYEGERKPPAAFFVELPFLQPLRSTNDPGRVLIDRDTDLPQNYTMIMGLQAKSGYSATHYRPYFDFISQDWAVNSRVNDLLNVRWVISKKKQDLPLVMSDPQSGLNLYERPTAFPRAWLASDSDALASGGKQKRPVKLLGYSAQRITLSVVTDAPDTLLLSEVAYPGWRATVNGKDIPVKRAAALGLKPLFRSVSLPTAGDYDIVLSYEPWWIF